MKDLSKIIDVTCFRDDLSDEDIKTLCRKLDHLRPRSLLVAPLYIVKAGKYLTGTGIRLSVLLDIGLIDTESKIALLERYIDLGIKEAYTVISPSLFKDRDFARAQNELAQLGSLLRKIDIIPVIRPSSFSKDSLSRFTRFLKRYRFETLALYEDGLVEDDDLITIKIVLDDMRLAVFLKDDDDIMYYAKRGFRRYITDDIERLLGRLYE